jgi:hypothetical protein
MRLGRRRSIRFSTRRGAVFREMIGTEAAHTKHYPYGGDGVLMTKPRAVTGAVVLGYVQAGITLITTVILFIGLFGGGVTNEGVAIGIVQLIGVGLLIIGSTRLGSGATRGVYVVAVALQLVICLYYLVRFVALDTDGIGLLEDVRAVATAVPIVLAIPPLIGLILALGGPATQFVTETRGRYSINTD